MNSYVEWNMKAMVKQGTSNWNSWNSNETVPSSLEAGSSKDKKRISLSGGNSVPMRWTQYRVSMVLSTVKARGGIYRLNENVSVKLEMRINCYTIPHRFMLRNKNFSVSPPSKATNAWKARSKDGIWDPCARIYSE